MENKRGKRISELRKQFNLNQTDFGTRIGLGQAAIGLIESGKRNVSDRVINDICREFNANREWIKTGEGNMLMLDMNRDELLAFLMGRLAADDDEFKKQFITEILEVILDMDQEACNNIKAMIRRLA